LTEVMGKKVCVKVWIHAITGDTSGHNNLVGHMNGSNMKYPYRDCKCELHELSKSRPKCKLVTLDEIRDAKKTPNGLASLSKKALSLFLTVFYVVHCRKHIKHSSYSFDVDMTTSTR
jgi:hypothetical protein